MSKINHAEDVDRRVWEVEDILNEVRMWMPTVILPWPFNCANTWWIICFSTNCRYCLWTDAFNVTNKHMFVVAYEDIRAVIADNWRGIAIEMHWRPMRYSVVNIEDSTKGMIAATLWWRRVAMATFSSMTGTRRISLVSAFHATEMTCVTRLKIWCGQSDESKLECNNPTWVPSNLKQYLRDIDYEANNEESFQEHDFDDWCQAKQMNLLECIVDLSTCVIQWIP